MLEIVQQHHTCGLYCDGGVDVHVGFLLGKADDTIESMTRFAMACCVGYEVGDILRVVAMQEYDLAALQANSIYANPANVKPFMVIVKAKLIDLTDV